MCCGWLRPRLLWPRRCLRLWNLWCRWGWQGWRCVCGVVVEGWEGWGECGVRRSPVGLLRRLPLSGRQASRLVVVGDVIDGLRRLSVALVELFLLLLDERAIACPMPFVLAMMQQYGIFYLQPVLSPQPWLVLLQSLLPPLFL